MGYLPATFICEPRNDRKAQRWDRQGFSGYRGNTVEGGNSKRAVITSGISYAYTKEYLKDYPDIVDCLEKNTSIEPRAINFFIRENKKQKFEVLFNEYFSNDFYLYTKEDVINSNLFGKGKENEIFRDILGDYLAIAKTNKTLLYGGSEILKSQHAGYTDDEIYVPLIVINTNNI